MSSKQKTDQIYVLVPYATTGDRDERELLVNRAVNDAHRFQGFIPGTGDVIRVGDDDWVMVVKRTVIHSDVFYPGKVLPAGVYMILTDCDAPLHIDGCEGASIPVPEDHKEPTYFEWMQEQLEQVKAAKLDENETPRSRQSPLF